MLKKAIPPQHNQLTGTYAVAASRADVAAQALTGQVHTAFSGELIDVLDRGLNNGKHYLDLDEIFRTVQKRIEAKQLPHPVILSIVTGGPLPFAVNAYYGLEAEFKDTPSQEMFDLQIAVSKWLDDVRSGPGILPEARLAEIRPIVRSGRSFLDTVRLSVDAGISEWTNDDLDDLAVVIADAEDAIDRYLGLSRSARRRAHRRSNEMTNPQALRRLDEDIEVLIERKRSLIDAIEASVSALRNLSRETSP